MDPFAKNFDAEQALREGCSTIDDDQTVRQLPSVDHFERFLCETDSELCRHLIEIEAENTQHIAASSSALPSGKRRESSLAMLCARKVQLQRTEPLSNNSSGDRAPPNSSTLTVMHSHKRSVDKKSVLYHMSEGTYGGPLGTLQKWMKQRTRVCITLRGLSRVNAVITAVIVAFDKHWNMVIRVAKPHMPLTWCTAVGVPIHPERWRDRMAKTASANDMLDQRSQVDAGHWSVRVTKVIYLHDCSSSCYATVGMTAYRCAAGGGAHATGVLATLCDR